MKINELVNEINECSSFTAEKDDDEKCIYIGTDSYDNLATIKYDVHYLDDVSMFFFPLDSSKHCRNLGNFYAFLNLINKFVNTPVKERYPENKYHLRWINDDDGTPNYLCNLDGTWCWSPTKRNADVFTEKELQQLKINNPKLAPAIDAMKEQV